MNSPKSDKWISELVGVFCDPIIVMPGGWGESLPDWIKPAITLERLIESTKYSKGELPTGTDAEACAYLFTASLTAPPSSDWTQIYLYVAGQVYERHRTKDSGVTMPEDIRVDKLSDYQTRKLDELKSWIYDRRKKARDEKRRGENRLAKAEAEEHRRETVGEQMFLPLEVK